MRLRQAAPEKRAAWSATQLPPKTPDLDDVMVLVVLNAPQACASRSADTVRAAQGAGCTVAVRIFQAPSIQAACVGSTHPVEGPGHCRNREEQKRSRQPESPR